MNNKILYIDDEAASHSGFKASFRKEYNVFTALNAEDALKILEKEKIKVIVSDQRMPVMKGTELFIKMYNENYYSIPILVSGYSDITDLIKCINYSGIFRFIQKPWKKEEMKEFIEEAIALYDTQQNKRDFYAEKTNENKELEEYIAFKEKNKGFQLGST